jgi:hypothetical protein
MGYLIHAVDPRHPELLADLRRALKAGANGM